MGTEGPRVHVHHVRLLLAQKEYEELRLSVGVYDLKKMVVRCQGSPKDTLIVILKASNLRTYYLQ